VGDGPFEIRRAGVFEGDRGIPPGEILIPQLVAFIQAALPTLVIVANGFQAGSPDDVVNIQRGAGTERPWFDRKDELVQVMTRAKNKVTAINTADSVYNLIRKKYGKTFPSATTAGGTVYPAIKAWAIRPVNTPQYIGDDDRGLALVVFTVEVTTT
jgi:hypothetical protein